MCLLQLRFLRHSRTRPTTKGGERARKREMRGGEGRGKAPCVIRGQPPHTGLLQLVASTPAVSVHDPPPTSSRVCPSPQLLTGGPSCEAWSLSCHATPACRCTYALTGQRTMCLKKLARGRTPRPLSAAVSDGTERLEKSVRGATRQHSSSPRGFGTRMLSAVRY